MAGVCCCIQFCCPPEKAAAALAEHLGIDVNDAARVLAEFALVPRTLEALAGAPHPQAGAEMLERLNTHVQHELRQILVALGHPVEEGGS